MCEVETLTDTMITWLTISQFRATSLPPDYVNIRTNELFIFAEFIHILLLKFSHSQKLQWLGRTQFLNIKHNHCI